MAQHVTMQQPLSGVVEDAQNITRFACLDQSGISECTQFPLRLQLKKVVTMQVDPMRKSGVVHQSDTRGLSALEIMKRPVG